MEQPKETRAGSSVKCLTQTRESDNRCSKTTLCYKFIGVLRRLLLLCNDQQSHLNCCYHQVFFYRTRRVHTRPRTPLPLQQHLAASGTVFPYSREAMESLTLEEKIEAFTEKMEELDSPATPAIGGPGSEPSVAQDFEKGEIAATKSRLVRKGLSVDGGDPHVATANEADELDVSPEVSEAGKAASLAAELDMGKIATPFPIPASTQNENASPAVAPAAMETTSTAVPAADQKRDEDTAKRATKPLGSLEGFSAKLSKAKAVHAALKARASPASQGGTQRQQRQYHRHRHSHVAGSASNGARSETRGGAAAGAVMDTKHSRPSKQNGAKRLVDPPARNASCVTSSAPVTAGLDVSPSLVAAGPAVNPARAVEHASPVEVTPEAAEEVGTRLHEQARWSRERLERRRKEGATPSFSRVISSNVVPVVMTPASAERSGNRLYEQAREARARLEIRRKEAMTSPLLPFTPQLWSNPRIGNPSVAGVARSESLYRDAILRNSKLEIARRAAERPIECTFTPELSKRVTSRDKAEKREGGDLGGGESGKVSKFDALYLDAKQRRANLFNRKELLWRQERETFRDFQVSRRVARDGPVYVKLSKQMFPPRGVSQKRLLHLYILSANLFLECPMN